MEKLKLFISFVVGIVMGAGGTILFMIWFASRN